MVAESLFKGDIIAAVFQLLGCVVFMEPPPRIAPLSADRQADDAPMARNWRMQQFRADPLMLRPAQQV